MKAVAVLSSPRTDANSAKISAAFLKKCKENGYKTETFVLNDLVFKGCQACEKCKTESERCVVSDGLTKVLNAMEEADILVLASPVYFGQISGQLKCFVDRTYCFLTPDFHTAENPSRLAPGKKCVILLTQGNPDSKVHVNIGTEYSEMFKVFGYETHSIRGFGMNNRTEAETSGFLLDEAAELADQLC